jgi:ArsR family transcriptional regulator, arsenate/arsenite/antimonite-responsive transcriptional repressor
VISQANCCKFDDFLKAMADENRQRMLALLQHGEMNAGELQAHFDLTQPTMSYHLSVLVQARLVSCRRDGKYVYYQANPDCVAEQCREILSRFRKAANHLSPGEESGDE